MRAQGLTASCLFSLPGITLDMVCRDVLHALDLGVSQDAIGNVLWEFLNNKKVCKGNNRGQRLTQLHKILKAHYKAIFYDHVCDVFCYEAMFNCYVYSFLICYAIIFIEKLLLRGNGDP